MKKRSGCIKSIHKMPAAGEYWLKLLIELLTKGRFIRYGFMRPQAVPPRANARF